MLAFLLFITNSKSLENLIEGSLKGARLLWAQEVEKAGRIPYSFSGPGSGEHPVR